MKGRDQEYVGRREKKDSGDGTTREKKKKRKIDAEIDGLCQPRHDNYRDNKR